MIEFTIKFSVSISQIPALSGLLLSVFKVFSNFVSVWIEGHVRISEADAA